MIMSIEVTVFIQEVENVLNIKVDPNQNVENFKRLLEFQTTILIKDQELTYEGKTLENIKLIKEYNIQNGDMIILSKKLPQTQPQLQQAKPQPQPQVQNRQPQGQGQGQGQRPVQGQGQGNDPFAGLFNMLPQLVQTPQQVQQQQQRRPENDNFDKIFANPDSLVQYYKENVELLNQLVEKSPQLANAILSEDKASLQGYIDAVKEQRRMQMVASQDPYSEEAQKLIYQAIQKENIDKNREHAIEHTPEVFGRVYMLYITCHINGHPIKAFVDTGAQQSIMTEKCAERCDLMRICDIRYAGIAKGVGTAKIAGRVHNTQLKIKDREFSIALSILSQAGQDTEFILGLDMLKRHQCLINLGKNSISFGAEGNVIEVEFLHEKDLKEILQSEELPENFNPSTTGTTTTNTTSPTTPNTTSPPIIKPPPQTQPTPTSTPTTNTTVPKPSHHPYQPVNKPPPQTQTQPQLNEESINSLVNLGCPRDQAIALLQRAQGNLEMAASIFFSMGP